MDILFGGQSVVIECVYAVQFSAQSPPLSHVPGFEEIQGTRFQCLDLFDQLRFSDRAAALLMRLKRPRHSCSFFSRVLKKRLIPTVDSTKRRDTVFSLASASRFTMAARSFNPFSKSLLPQTRRERHGQPLMAKFQSFQQVITSSDRWPEKSLKYSVLDGGFSAPHLFSIGTLSKDFTFLSNGL